jgi:hypothetical protein
MPYIPTIPGTDHHHQTANFIEDVVLVTLTLPPDFPISLVGISSYGKPVIQIKL